MSITVDRLLFVPIAAIRPYLVLRGTLLLLAFDLWISRIEHAGRYGAGGFNVAHFEWLDALQPQVSPALYVGVCALVGIACFVAALVPRPPRWLLGGIAVVHSWSWAMSMLDSYQHHYLLSLVLLALAFFPATSLEEATAPPTPLPTKSSRKTATEPTSARLLAPAPTAPAWAYAALCASFAIVYAYTAFSKTSVDWLSGVAMQRVLGMPAGGDVTGDADPVSFPRAIAAGFGIEGESFWWALGHSVVLVQIVCAAGYLLAPWLDVARSRVIAAFGVVAMLTALSFHVGAEILELKIEWFSWYMIYYALVVFLPARVLVAIVRTLIPTERQRLDDALAIGRTIVLLIALLAAWRAGSWKFGSLAFVLLVAPYLRVVLRRRFVPAVAVALGGAGAIAIAVAGNYVDLPGAFVAAVVAASAIALAPIARPLVAGFDIGRLAPYGIALGLAAASLYASVAWSTVRWDFYRNVGGDHRRRGEYRTAYEAYVKANRYAPPGEGRQREEAQMRRMLEERGEL